ncbi:dTDP-4-dehydrorhamnose 3,5-epimerase [Mycobacterium sp. BK558]|nr:dTDP-4-dehydrorhamnose 3,5-epimerase [Mycobacterium sp. BK558]
MRVRELAVTGAWELTPVVHADPRGAFFEWFTDAEFTAMTGHRLDLRQANCSVSRAGVLRGVHFAQVPPSQAKYVTCVRGAVYDVVVDIRVGSPTFGRWDAVTLDDHDRAAPSLDQAQTSGLLPSFEEARAFVSALGSRPTAPPR